MSIMISRATREDLERLVPLFDAYRQFYGQTPDLGKARGFLAKRLEHNEAVVFIAMDEDAAVGFTQLYPSFSSVRAARTYLLNDLFVTPAARRQGVADGLLTAAAAFARADGALRLTLSTAVDNRAAQALYERHGWQLESGFLEYSLPLT